MPHYDICNSVNNHVIAFMTDKTQLKNILEGMEGHHLHFLKIKVGSGIDVKEYSANTWLEMQHKTEPKSILISEFKKLLKKYKENDALKADLDNLQNRLVRVI